MAKVKHLTVSLENQPGRMAAVAKVLADAKVNIVAVLGSTAGEHGSVQVVVDNITKAKKALSSAQFAYAVGTLEQAELSNKPGALAEYAAKLARKASISTQHMARYSKGRRNHYCFSRPQEELGVPAMLLTNDGVLQSEIDRDT